MQISHMLSDFQPPRLSLLGKPLFHDTNTTSSLQSPLISKPLTPEHTHAHASMLPDLNVYLLLTKHVTNISDLTSRAK